ncbi:hypothetical protein Rhopal_001961-T1 [Rhodotorula paludigena]|uniref:F-box protein Hrt3/FBXO9 C-terminal domain-containing protein n=1 Tax=Rhodotorula paludigena TaxID=86838 RepID=A0AAV5GGX0_9BASI|nr:hypothetical protein Rhopal_001961-T1 [Rhodotorula paludigena]
MSAPPSGPAAPGLEDELSAFRAQWLAETRRKERKQADAAASTSQRHHRAEPSQPGRTLDQRTHRSPERPKPARSDAGSADDELAERTQDLRIEEDEEKQVETSPKGKGEARELRTERERPRSALELYEDAVVSEREGRMHDALVNYRTAFRLDPDVDRAYHLASVAAAQKHAASSRRAEPHTFSVANGGTAPPPRVGEFRFERTVQLAPDYDAKREHRSKEEAQREAGSADADVTHPSSTGFLLNSLLNSIAANPYVRPPPPVHAAAAPPSSPSAQPAPLPPTTGHAESETDAPRPSPMTPEEALATLHFIPADEEQPLPLAHLPHEVLLLILRHLVLSSMLPPPRPANPHPEDTPVIPPGPKSKRLARKRTLKEEMQLLETELELEDVEREWRSDVEALERFARVCRAARVVTLDSELWRSLCLRTYVPPQQISRDETALQLVKQHGNDWRRFYIEHPRIRLDGAYISVVTYLRRGETQSIYAPTHLITFYRYFRFYHHGLVLSLLTTDPPKEIVRRLNPTLRMKGLSFGRWRLRGDLVELWGLEDPSVEESRRKYSFRMNCRFKSTARGRMNKLEMLSMATEHRQTLELEPIPIAPTKPFFFSKVHAYVGEDRPEVEQDRLREKV